MTEEVDNAGSDNAESDVEEATNGFVEEAPAASPNSPIEDAMEAGDDASVTEAIVEVLKSKSKVAGSVLAYLMHEMVLNVEKRKWDGIVKSTGQDAGLALIHCPEIALVFGLDVLVNKDLVEIYIIGSEVTFEITMKEGKPHAHSLEPAFTKVISLDIVPPCMKLRQKLQDLQNQNKGSASASARGLKRKHAESDSGDPKAAFLSMFDSMLIGTHTPTPRPVREFEEVKPPERNMVADASKMMARLMGNLGATASASASAGKEQQAEVAEAGARPPPPPPPPPQAIAEPVDMIAEANRKMREIMGMGGQAKSVPANYAPKPGDWRCVACDCLVLARRGTCQSCGTANPNPTADVEATPEGGIEAGTRPGDWKCSSCEKPNFSSRTACKHCQNSRGTAARLNTKPGDWICPGCGDLVFSSKDKCKMCNTAKPADAETVTASAPPPPPPPAAMSAFAALMGGGGAQPGFSEAQLQQAQAAGYSGAQVQQAQAAQQAQLAQMQALASLGLTGYGAGFGLPNM